MKKLTCILGLFIAFAINANAQLVSIMDSLPTISADPANATICETNNTMFIVVASVTGGVTFQWQEDQGSGFADITDGGGVYSGLTNDTLVITGGTNAMSGYVYRCVVSSVVGGCGINSASATLTVNSLPLVTVTPSGPTTFCQGDSVTLTSSVATSYLWNTAEITPAITTDTAGSYTVSVTDGNGCSALSSVTTVIVNSLPIATITAGGPTTFCQGDSVILTSSAGSSYLWNTAEITPSIKVDTAGSYTVTVTDANGCSASSIATAVVVDSLASFSLQPVNTSACQNLNAVFTSNASATGGVTFQWQVNTGSGWTNLVGETSNTLILIGVSNSMNSYLYRNQVTTVVGGCTSNSTTVILTVNANPIAPSVTSNGVSGKVGNYCEGGAGTIFSLGSSQNAYDYELQDFTTSAPISNVAGTGGAISFPAQPVGTFKIEITSLTGCTTIIQ